MGILDQLIEKKDVVLYTHFRRAILEQELKRMKEIPLTRREKFKQNLLSRQNELKVLRHLVEVGQLKKQSIKYWDDLNSKGVLKGKDDKS